MWNGRFWEVRLETIHRLWIMFQVLLMARFHYLNMESIATDFITIYQRLKTDYSLIWTFLSRIWILWCPTSKISPICSSNVWLSVMKYWKSAKKFLTQFSVTAAGPSNFSPNFFNGLAQFERVSRKILWKPLLGTTLIHTHIEREWNTRYAMCSMCNANSHFFHFNEIKFNEPFHALSSDLI